MVHVYALSSSRRILFDWRCVSVVEARLIVRNLTTIFGHCLSNITLTTGSNVSKIMNKEAYDTVKHFTYETHPSYYMSRR